MTNNGIPRYWQDSSNSARNSLLPSTRSWRMGNGKSSINCCKKSTAEAAGRRDAAIQEMVVLGDKSVAAKTIRRTPTARWTFMWSICTTSPEAVVTSFYIRLCSHRHLCLCLAANYLPAPKLEIMPLSSNSRKPPNSGGVTKNPLLDADTQRGSLYTTCNFLQGDDCLSLNSGVLAVCGDG